MARGPGESTCPHGAGHEGGGGVTPNLSAAQLLSELEEPLRRALERLAPAFPDIRSRWQASLARLVRRRDELERVGRLALDGFAPLLAAGDFDAYARELERRGQELAAERVAEEHAALALALYLEQALAWLAGQAPGDAEMAVALGRLVSVGQLYLHE